MQVNKFGDPEHFISVSLGAILNVIIPVTSRELRVIPHHMIIYKQFTFDAAHFLPRVPEGHKCRQLHGHTYHLTVFVSGPVIEPEGWVVDFGDLKAACKPVIARLDHSLLNELPALKTRQQKMWSAGYGSRSVSRCPACTN